MEKSSFFNAVLDQSGNPDRIYLAEDFAQFFSTFIGNGVFPNPSTQCQVVAIDNNMTIRIKSGFGWINGYMYQNTGDYIFDLDPADGVLDRVDRVVLRLDFLERKIRRAVKKGDYASNAVPKTLQRDADAYEIALADVYVNKGIISITQANITDLRLNKDLCGIVHGTVDQADTTAIFNQFQSWYTQTKANYDNDMATWTQAKKDAFDNWYTTNTMAFMEQFSRWYETNTTQWGNDFSNWFSTIKGQLDGDVAAKLSADVVDLKEGKVDKVTGKGLSANDYSDAEKQEVAKIPNIESQLGEMENKKVNYTDLTPVTTTGTESAYIATIPNGITEVTIVPHIDNLEGATLNSIQILDREGKPIEKGTLKINIPTKIVRVGSNFFIVSRGGNVRGVLPYALNYAKGINKVYPLPYSNVTTVLQRLATIIDNKLYIIYVDSGDYKPNRLMIDTVDLSNLLCTHEIVADIAEYTPYVLALNNNIIYLVGGSHTSVDKYLRKYNLLTRERTTNTIQAMLYNPAHVFKEDKLYMFGGWLSGTTYAKNYTYVLDTTLNTISLKQSMSVSRTGAIAALTNEKIYVIGGHSEKNDTAGDLNVNECYDTLTNTWMTKAAPPFRAVKGGSIAVDEHNIIIITERKLQYAYDSVLDTWTQLSDIAIPNTTSTIRRVDSYSDNEVILTNNTNSYLFKF
jgi:hypothetical protein